MNLESELPAVQAYLQRANLFPLPGFHLARPVTAQPLAQGEYNLNYLVRQGRSRWVLRVNTGTQIGREDQIQYEYRALTALQASGVTPEPYAVDSGPEAPGRGVLWMEYLPGRPLNYRRDSEAAAHLFARLHQYSARLGTHSLIVEHRPLSMTWEECARLLQVYFDFTPAEAGPRAYLQEVLAWAGEARQAERFFTEDPWKCVINTEVNSGNFIVNRARGTLHLVDWEKPLWGDPSQDLSHFSVPTTTLWKTTFRFSPDGRRDFLAAYSARLHDAHLRDTLVERVRLRDPFNCLRGVSWCAMARVQYHAARLGPLNPDTAQRLDAYLELPFLRSLFDPFLNRVGD